MSAQDCIQIIKDAAGRELTDDEINDLVSELQRRIRERRTVGKLDSLEDELLGAADELAAEVETAALIERRNAAINIKIHNDLLNFADEADKVMGSPALGVEARTVGVNAPIPGGRLSVDARQNSLTNEYLGGMIADLRRQDLLPVLNNRGLDRQIARELAEIKPDGNPGVSGSKEARTIAQIIDKYRKVSVSRENRAGAWIKPLPGYITRQNHDMHRVRRAGFEAWRDFILPRLDADATFGDAKIEDFLRGSYDGIVTGRHLTANGADESDLKFAFKGPGNLAKRVSQHRVLHFKSADDWFDYNEQFGNRSLMDSITQNFERAARNTALMETYGPNPRAMFDRVLDELKDKHRGDVKKFDDLSKRKLESQIDEVTGMTRIPVEPSTAWVASSVRAVQSMAKLGGATLSALADVGFKAGEIRRQGDNVFSAWGKSLSSFVDGVVPDDRRAVAELIGVGMDGQIGDIAARFSATDSLPGFMSKLQQRFFKFNLLAPWTDAHKRGLGLMMARDLAMQKGKSWDALPDATRAMLARYELDGAKWDTVRAAVRKEADGREYLMPDAVKDISDDAIRAFLDNPKASARTIQRAKDGLQTALRAYYVDRADFAIPTPGAREHAILRQGTRSGTAVGEALRFVMQFKAFPVTVLTKPVGADVYGGGARTFRDAILKGQGDLLGLAHMITSTTILGYVAQSAKELTKGRTPRDPTDLATWNAALLQGGGMGIYGDFLFGEYNRFGRSLLDTIAGPSLGTISDVAELWARFRAGEDSAAGAVRFLMSNAPFINLFYTRAALDYLIFFQLQEAINPGFLRRMERRIQKENSQTFILPPSQAIPRGGGTRPLEGVR